MKSQYSQVFLRTILAGFVGVASVSAEEKTSWFSNPFAVSSGTESVPSPGGGNTMEGVTLVTPSRIAYDRASPLSHWSFGYQPEFEFRYGTARLKSWNHAADATFGHRFSRRTKLDFGHSFVKSSDPSRIFIDNIFVMPRDSFRENATAMTLSHEASGRTTLNFRFDNTITKMSSGGDAGATILNQYGAAGTAGVSQLVSPRQKITLSYSLLKFSPYRFDTAVDAAQFAANIPTVQAGIARFASSLATSVSRSSPTPTGMVSGGQQSGSSTGSTPSTSGSSSGGASSSTTVSVAGQDAGVSLSATPVSAGGTTTTAAVTTAGTPVAGVAPTISTTASVSLPAAPTPTAPATVATTVSVPLPPAPTPTAPPSVATTVVVQPPTVPLVPTVTAPVINPTLPLVGVVTPLPTVPSPPSEPCELLNNIPCPTTSSVTTTPGATTVTQVTAPLAKSLAVAPTATAPSTAAPTADAASPAEPSASASSAASPAPSSSAPQSEVLLGRPFHVLSATYTYAMDPGLLFEVSGGAMRDRDMTYLLSFQVERRFTRMWLAGGYQRFLSFFGTMPFQGSQPGSSIPLPNGVEARSVFSAVTGRVGGKLNRRTDMEMSISLSKSSANFVVHDLRTAIGRARISYWLNNKLSLFADVDSFLQNGSEVGVTRLSRQRYFGGLQVRLSSPTAPPQMAGN